jgi:hypothetical protein
MESTVLEKWQTQAIRNVLKRNSHTNASAWSEVRMLKKEEVTKTEMSEYFLRAVAGTETVCRPTEHRVR